MNEMVGKVATSGGQKYSVMRGRRQEAAQAVSAKKSESYAIRKSRGLPLLPIFTGRPMLLIYSFSGSMPSLV